MRKYFIIIFWLFSLIAKAQQVAELDRYNNQAEITSNHAVRLLPGFVAPAGSKTRVHITPNGGINVGTKPNTLMNTIITYTAKQPGIVNLTDTANGTNQVNVEVQTFDHFGRVKEIQQVKVTPDLNNLVQVKSYDAASNEWQINLPYVQNKSLGAFHDKGYTAVGHSYYSGLSLSTSSSMVSNGYYENVYDHSPLARLVEQSAPGAAFSTADHHTIRTDVIVSGTGIYAYQGTTALYINEGMYEIYDGKALRTERTEDENVPHHAALQSNGVMTVYVPGAKFKTTNYRGQVLLTGQVNPGVEVLKTYYVYDNRGNLTFVLPPKYEGGSGIADTAKVNALAYQYRYDDQSRMIAKKLPGKGWEYMVYNKLNQVVMSQDAVQRGKASQEWNVIKYDLQGRVALTGLYVQSGSSPNTDYRAAMQTSVDAQTAEWETRAGSGNGYTTNTYPTSGVNVLSVNYYDDYDFPVTNPYPYAAGSKLTRGLPTATRTAVLGTTDLLWAITYYDDDSRAVKTFKQHYKGATLNAGNYDELTNTYDFTGQVTTSVRSHKVAGTETLKTFDEYTYDHMGRKLDSWQTINTGTRTLLARNQYDELGKLYKKKLHSTDGVNFLQTITYGYNQRGWLVKAQADKFDLQLRYNETTKGAKPQYNGNIAEQEYTGANSGNKWFTYGYDVYNRLTSAVYSTDALSERLTYDQNGNITSLKRGPVSNTATSYSYAASGNSNRLMGLSGGLSGNFTYNINGNLLTDSRRSVTNISYNHLNLPTSVTGNGGASYSYNAGGAKLSSLQGSTTREYIDGLQYTNGAIDFIATEEGRALRNDTTGAYKYEYNLKDHLGNTRVTIDENAGVARVVQEDEYYAFGLNAPRSRVSTENKYLYNGKEEQDILSDELDYGARFYDPVVGRWTSVDPSAEEGDQESLAPYQYGMNNPIRYTDPDGRCPTCIPGLIGAGVGSLVGGLIEGSSQLYHNGSITSWKAVGGAALQGGITGGVAGLTGGASLMATTGAVAGANVVGGATNRAIQGQRTTVKDVAVDAAVGAAVGFGGKLLQGAPKPAANVFTKEEAKSIASFEKNIAQHEAKLKDYLKDPLKYDNKGTLKNASDEVKEKIIAGRTKHLQKEISNFKENIQKVRAGANNRTSN